MGREKDAPAGAGDRIFSSREVQWVLDIGYSALDDRVTSRLVSVRGAPRPGPGTARGFPFTSIVALAVLESLVDRFRAGHEGVRPILAAICACSAEQLEDTGEPLFLVWDGEAAAPEILHRREAALAVVAARNGPAALVLNLSHFAADVRRRVELVDRMTAPDAPAPTVEEAP